MNSTDDNTRAGPESAVASIRDLMQKAIGRQVLPGAVVLVSRNGETVYRQAFGVADRESGRPQQIDDLFYLGSTSKPLAASCIMSLVDSGDLALDTPVVEFLPEFGQARLKNGNHVRPPVIAELLSHTSGIFGNATASRRQQQLVWNFGSTLAKTAVQIAKQPLIYTPGEGFSYGGASMIIAGRIAELIADREFDEFARDTLFARLGMLDTFYRSDVELSERMSVLYTKSAGGIYKARFQPNPSPGSFVLPPGGIISTARDLALFLHQHLNCAHAAQTGIISERTVAAMLQDLTGGKVMDFRSASRKGSSAAIANNEGYGLGWMLDELDRERKARVFFHGGAFGTLIWGDTTAKLGIVLLTHIPLAQVAQLWDELIRHIRGAWGEPES